MLQGGAIYTLIGFIVQVIGTGWIERFMPPVVTGSVVAVIGLNLAFSLPLMGGVSIVVFGLIAVAGARIWLDNKVDFSDKANLIVADVTLVLDTGDLTLKLGGFSLGGIGTATFDAILLYALLG